MKTHFTSSHTAVAAASIIAALSFSGVAQAITDTVFNYSTPRPGLYSVDHMAMVPDGTSAANADYSNRIIEGLVTGTDDTCFTTGINLPNGARLTSVRIYYVNGTSSPGPVGVDFIAHRLADGVVETLGSKGFADHSIARKIGALPIGAGIVINNGARSYGLRVCLFTFQTFYAAKIAYTVNNAGD